MNLTSCVKEFKRIICIFYFNFFSESLRLTMNMNETNAEYIREILLANGYKYTKLMNGYYCCNKYINCNDEIIEIEVKVRDLLGFPRAKPTDYQESNLIIELHRYLDNICSTDQKIIYTYLKYKLHCIRNTHPKAYSFIKKLFYNMGHY